MRYIDLRSDTVTLPTAEMREAMARAEVGDDVYLEDPTVNRLQERSAELFGKEAALFVPTGTMGNQICVNLHTRPGQEVVIEERSHMFNLEVAALAALNGVMPRTLRGANGILDWAAIEPAIRPRAYSVAQTGLIAIENTHNLAGGTVTPLDQMEEICDGAHASGIPVHLDGARVFNAAVFLRRNVAALARPFDSVMFCLSKGLGAPVGSVIAGSRAFVDRALRVRKMFGGGMRQAGVIAAAGLVALETMTGRLEEDHANARFLAKGLMAIPGIGIDPENVQTNILRFDLGAAMTTSELSRRLKERGVLAVGIDERQMRLVTHKDISRGDCETALAKLREVTSEG